MEPLAHIAARYRTVATQRIVDTVGMPITFYVHAGDKTYTLVVPPEMTTPAGKALSADVVRRIVERVKATAVIAISEVWVVRTPPEDAARVAGRSLAEVEGREEKLLVLVETPTETYSEMCGIARHPKTGLVADIIAAPESERMTRLAGTLTGYFRGPQMVGDPSLTAAVDVLASDTISRPAPAPAPVTH